MGDWNATVPTFVAGAKNRASNAQILADIATALTTAWSTWTPTLTNLTLGTGTSVGRYRRLGKTVDYRWKFTLASGSAVGTGPRFTLPVAPHAGYLVTVDPLGRGTLGDALTNSYVCEVRLVSGSTVEIVSLGTNSVHAAVTATAPFTWSTSGDTISVFGTYEAA